MLEDREISQEGVAHGVVCRRNAHYVSAGRACVRAGWVNAHVKVGVVVARCMSVEHVDVGPSCSELVVRGMVYRDVAHGGSVGLVGGGWAHVLHWLGRA